MDSKKVHGREPLYSHVFTEDIPMPPSVGSHDSTLRHPPLKDLVDTTCANTLLIEFCIIVDYFSFIIISLEIISHDLEIQKPMLFLAICMIACGKIRLLQTTLEERFRRELSFQTIVNAQKSRDCLQSILVYLAL